MATSQEVLSGLGNERRVIKGRITKLTNYIAAAAARADTEPPSRKVVLEVESRSVALKEIYVAYNDKQNEIDSRVSEDQLTIEENERERVNGKLYTALAEYSYFLEKFDASNSSNSSQSTGTGPSSEGVNRRIVSDIKLPTIQIPQFDGSYDRWLEFNDIFSALVHTNANLSKIQQFYYLKSALTGDAAGIVQSVEVSDTNYDIAWTLVTERFKNDSLMVNNYVKSLFDMSPIERENSSALRTLVDTALKNMRCLKSLGQPTETWDTLIIYMLIHKIDSTTNREWQQERGTRKALPTFSELVEFLKRKCNMLENLTSQTKVDKVCKQTNPRPSTYQSHSYSLRSSSHVSISKLCAYCKRSGHSIYYCTDFKQLAVQQRIKETRKANVCFNCLGQGHSSRICRSGNCKICNGFHHTLLHLQTSNETKSRASWDDRASAARQSSPTPGEPVPGTYSRASWNDRASSARQSAATPRSEGEPVYDTYNHSKSNLPSRNGTETVNAAVHNDQNVDHEVETQTEVLLSTAVVEIKDASGGYQLCRALLDPGSQSNFITQAKARQLGLRSRGTTTKLLGINHSRAIANQCTIVNIRSRFSSYSATVPCLLVSKVTEDLPLKSFDKRMLNISQNYNLADPDYHKSRVIDLLIGAELFWELLCDGQTVNGSVRMQKTQLGWVLGGRLPNIPTAVSCTSIDKQIVKFWEIESINQEFLNTAEDTQIENHFLANTKRNGEGRFVVKLPFKNDFVIQGGSKSNAEKRFHLLERRFKRNDALKLAYVQIMDEFLNAKLLTEVNCGEENSYYMPHHPVVKEASLTTKVRVVFDASCPTSCGISLNSMQLTGPVIQDELYSILLRFRKHRYVITADIEKMYLQILLHTEHKKYHRILWRPEENMPLKTYELNALTFGTTSAPFLATRCLVELANIHRKSYPVESEIIRKDFYMDDLLTGSNSITELKDIKTNIGKILESGKFTLRKYLSNLRELSVNCTNDDIRYLNLDYDKDVKTLGLIWNASTDTLQTSYERNKSSNEKLSKRIILAQTAQFFDPLGVFTPVIIIPKIIIQKLWSLRVTWDEVVPQAIQSEWLNLHEQLPVLSESKIQRCVIIADYNYIEMHGFADASMKAYGACVYVKSISTQGTVQINLLTAKSRVAPLKMVTLPRLELCAAHLLSQLIEKTKNALLVKFDKVYCWTDSTVTLCWIRSDANRWKTFIQNRVTEIQANSDNQEWRHVPSKLNPADLISRGCFPKQLVNLQLWWQGPGFLADSQSEWPTEGKGCPVQDTSDEQRIVILLNVANSALPFLNRYSTFNKQKRVLSYVMRFISNARTPEENRITGYLTCKELSQAELLLIKSMQADGGKTDQARKNSIIASLGLFLDTVGVLRVGGRMQNSGFSFEKKHPAIVAGKHPLTRLVIQETHLKMLHCGPQELLYTLRQRYWPTGGRDLCKRICRECVVCFKANPKPYQTVQGQLPKDRVKINFPFQKCGIDYAGPFNIRDRKGRNFKTHKCYICLFVCFATRAIHLELVTDLTTEAFMAAFRRFASRRGCPDTLYSDNGTNFVGANSELKRLYEFQRLSYPDIQEILANQGVSWPFIPPRAPHFGGLWEAGVKSVKYHLKRVWTDALLTYEDMLTVLVQIEGILNSRPISILSNHPSDPLPLTPAHFLIGRSFENVADSSYFHVAENRLGHYQRLQMLIQSFWKRWSKEHISNLQVRTSWRIPAQRELTEGALVIIKEDNQPPAKWKLGRITQLHPGQDRITRVVTILSGGKHITRAVARICQLPTDESLPTDDLRESPAPRIWAQEDQHEK